jgi:hypothetical protein
LVCHADAENEKDFNNLSDVMLDEEDGERVRRVVTLKITGENLLNDNG